MYKHLQNLVKKYQKLLAAANRLKCGKKVKSSIMGTLNRLRGSLNRLYKAMHNEPVTFKNPFLFARDLPILLAWWDAHDKRTLPSIKRIISTI